eukprot:1158228-Pelagomonas_calceolata.AAC.3
MLSALNRIKGICTVNCTAYMPPPPQFSSLIGLMPNFRQGHLRHSRLPSKPGLVYFGPAHGPQLPFTCLALSLP